MFSIFKKKKEFTSIILAPVDGVYSDVCSCPDESFGSGALGPGYEIKPTGDLICSPVDGKIVMIFPSGHAIGIKRDDDLEILIHVGIDTVNLNGEGFTIYAKQGQNVSAGDKLSKFDRNLIKEKGYRDDVMMVFTNAKTFEVKKGKDGSYQGKEEIGDVRKA